MELSKILLIIISTFGVEEYSANLFLLLNEKKNIFIVIIFNNFYYFINFSTNHFEKKLFKY